MSVSASRRARRADSIHAGSFAITGAALLRHLSVRSAGNELRERLEAMEACLRAGSVRLTVDDGRILVNDVPVPPDSAADWLAPLCAGGVAEVTFDAGTTARELLLFGALLVAPGDASALARTWMANGSWRIHVTTASHTQLSGTESSTPPASTQPLAGLCDAVARGDARAEDGPVLTALRAHGAAATEALLFALARTDAGCQRRLLFDAVVAVGEGAEHLIAALHHDEWHVVRNAAALLGELKLDDAAIPLAAACAHQEYRVRIAAVTALGQLDTDRARETLAAMVDDPHPAVRARAWLALGHCTAAPPAALLNAALRRADEPQVEYAILTCAAAFPTLDVSSGLIRFCAREFSQRSPKELVVFGVEQLALRRPASAKAFVSRLPERLARVE